jgi:peptidoglycan/LPS O-acetylase OafA/YrhL
MQRRDRDSDRAGPGQAERGAWIGRARRGLSWIGIPFRSFPRGEIVAGARLIGGLAAVLWRGVEDDRFRTGEDKVFDVRATAFLHGMTEAQLEVLLRRRRKETARASYLAFGLGWLSFAAWVGRAATVPWTSSQFLPALEFAPFCLVFFLLAFKSALLNFQIRMRRLVSAVEFLRTTEAFWPR